MYVFYETIIKLTDKIKKLKNNIFCCKKFFPIDKNICIYLEKQIKINHIANFMSLKFDF